MPLPGDKLVMLWGCSVLLSGFSGAERVRESVLEPCLSRGDLSGTREPCNFHFPTQPGTAVRSRGPDEGESLGPGCVVDAFGIAVVRGSCHWFMSDFSCLPGVYCQVLCVVLM